MKQEKSRKWNEKITSIMIGLNFLKSRKIGFYRHATKDIEIDLTASGDSEFAVRTNIIKQLLEKLA